MIEKKNLLRENCKGNVASWHPSAWEWWCAGVAMIGGCIVLGLPFVGVLASWVAACEGCSV